MPHTRERGWWSRLTHPAGGYSRTRRITLWLGIALILAGGLLAVLAPEAMVPVPEVPSDAGGALALRYVRSIPEQGATPLLRPVGVAVGDGRVYVADSAAAAVRVFSATGSDMGDVGVGILEVPTYVAYDPTTDTVLVSDRAAGALLRLSEDDSATEEVRPSTEPTTAWEPLGVDVDEGGRIAVTDSSNRHRLLVLEPDGTVALEVGGTPSAETTGSVRVALDYPNSVLMAGERVWVADSNNRRVLVFSTDGELEQVVRIDGVARGLAYVPGTTDADSYAVVTDVLGSQIVLLDMQGAEVGRFGGPGTGEGRLAYPNDVAYDESTGLLYVADTGNALVQVWEVQPAGTGEGAAGGLPGAVQTTPAMMLGGLLLAALGLVIVGATVWPRLAESGGQRPEESGEASADESRGSPSDDRGGRDLEP